MTERIPPPYVDEPVTWLDDDHFVELIHFATEVQKRPSRDEEPNGGILWHRKADNPDGWCCGSFYWQPAAYQNVPVWQLVSREPLHLEPSFLCHCGHHGFIREGKWISV